MVTFAYLLSQLGGLFEVTATRDWPWVGRQIIEDFLEAVRRHSPQIKHLRPPEPIDDSMKVSLQALEASLPHLEVYDGITKGEELDIRNPPSFHLQQLVATTSLDQSRLSWIISNSFDSLTSLTFLLTGNPLDAVSDLSSLRNLSTLCIIADYKLASEPLDEDCCTRISDPPITHCLRTLLSTVNSLPLEHFCLVTPILSRASVEEAIWTIEPLVRTSQGISWPGEVGGNLDLVLYASESIQPFQTFAIPDALADTETWRGFSDEGARIKHLLELDKVRAVEKCGFKVGISFQSREVLPLFERAMTEEEGDTETEEDGKEENE